jgi:hypothetical protein
MMNQEKRELGDKKFFSRAGLSLDILTYIYLNIIVQNNHNFTNEI